ncbi:hypothetical protein NE237_000899 [Protea cynaroides]|uniref:Fibronectin type III-like domain-containing protein n=1 Tax=Protea cynaroides TaxID=273540 RepID=A0A9Q0QXM0_9MAGN|nr:hypothetical protein NE237_000899 [Protea cynaroides]
MPLRPVDELGYPGRTCKFFNGSYLQVFQGSTIYPFGYGLSYTQFSYKILFARRSVEAKLNINQHCRRLNYLDDAGRPLCESMLVDDLDCSTMDYDFEVEVQNIGIMDGDDVLIVYPVPLADIIGTHLKQVIWFQRVFVPAGQTKNVKFTLNACTQFEFSGEK